MWVADRARGGHAPEVAYRSAADRGAWTHARADAGHTSWVDAEPVLPVARVRWRRDLTCESRAAPALEPRLRRPIDLAPRGAPLWIVAAGRRVVVPGARGRAYMLDAGSGEILESVAWTAGTSPILAGDGSLAGAEPTAPLVERMQDADGLLTVSGGRCTAIARGRVSWTEPGWGTRIAAALGPGFAVLVERRYYMHAEWDHLVVVSRRDGAAVADLEDTLGGVAVARDIVYHCPLPEGGVAAVGCDGRRRWALSAVDLAMAPSGPTALAATSRRVFAYDSSARAVACLEPDLPR